MPIGAVLGVASAVGGIAQASSAKKAAKNTTDAQLQIFRENTEINEPMIGARDNALAALMFEAGIGPQPTARNALSIEEIPSSGNTLLEMAYGGREGAPLGYREVQGGGQPQFAVGERLFNSREEAQDYIDSQSAGFDYTPIDMPDPNLDFSNEAFEASPGYQFRLDEGQKAIERMAAARGMRFSGNVLKDLTRFTQGSASDERARFVGETVGDFNRKYGVRTDKLNLLRGIAGLGQSGAAAQQQAGNTFADNVGRANSQAAIGVGNAITGTINSGANILGMANSGYLGQNPGFGIKPAFNPFAGATS